MSPHAEVASFQQQGLWLTEQLQQPGDRYNVLVCYAIQGDLDVAGLEQALAALVDRHRTLRTGFELRGDTLLRVEHEVGDGLFRCVDGAYASADAAIDEICKRPFNLRTGPLIRTLLVRRGPDRYDWYVVIHHITTDGSSRAVFNTDLSILYAHFANGSPLPPPLACDYGAHTRRQQELLASGEIERQQAAWRERVGDVPHPVADAGVPGVSNPATDVAIISSTIDATLSAQLRTLAKDQGGTQFMAVLGAFGILLARRSGRDDFFIGVPLFGRQRPEFRELMGYFVNVLPFRIDLRGQPSFAELVRRIDGERAHVLAKQDVSMAHLVAALQIPRTASAQGFESVFAWQNVPIERLDLPGCTTQQRYLESKDARFPIEAQLWKAGDGEVRAELRCNPAVIGPEEAATLIDSYGKILRAAVAEPDQPIASGRG